MRRRHILRSPCCPLLLLLFFAGASWGLARELPPVTSGGNDFGIPNGASRLAYRLASSAPQPVLDFRAARGLEWQVFWDADLGTPRTFFPLRPVPLAPREAVASEGDRSALVRAVRRFVDENAGFIGLDASRLGEPAVLPIGKHLSLVFPQTTPSGIPVRGANLRVTVLEDGRLAWAKAFVARGIEDPEGELLAEEEVRGLTEASGGAVLAARLEISFPGGDLESAAPVWSLWVLDGEQVSRVSGRPSEHIVDARSGEVLARRVVVKRFEGAGAGISAVVEGVVRAAGPDLGDIFASPWELEGRTESVLKAALVEDVKDPEGLRTPRTVAKTDEDGSFVYETVSADGRATAQVSLQTGHFEDPQDPQHSPFVPVLQVRPLPSLSPLEPLPGEGALNLGHIPSLSLTEAANREFALKLNDRTAPGSRAYVERAHWLQSYEAGRRVMDFAESGLRALFELSDDTVRHQWYLPVQLLHIRPVSPDFFGNGFPPGQVLDPAAQALLEKVLCVQSYKPPAPGDLTSAAVIETGLYFSTVEEGQGFCDVENRVEFVPTLLQHEVGHHVFFHLTRAHNEGVAVEGIEEAVADVVAAYANEDPRIGYAWNADKRLVVTALGFSLTDSKSGSFRKSLRRRLAEGFWELRVHFTKEPTPEVAEKLLLGWLIHNAVAFPGDRAFDGIDDFLVDLLFVDEYWVKGDGADENVANGTPHEKAIRDIFRGKLPLDASFVRGDANLDQKVDITDAVAILNYLFRGQGGYHDCKNALDADDNSEINVTDAIWLLSYLFLGGPPTPHPSRVCGVDFELPSDPGNLGCIEYTCPD
ncbi:MAG: hypothetical protein HY721_17650 [Planctomycetes bacterium]|nr:hypothetical protein [Planctomycetota bacterium]